MHDLSEPGSLQFESADEKLLDEIVRQAELLISAQLTTALASDQRSLIFASVVSALFTVLVGTAATLLAQYGSQAVHLIWFLPMLSALAVSMFYAVTSCRPIKFHAPGHNPKNWLPDIENKSTLHRAKSEIAAQYSKHIQNNDIAMVKNGKLLTLAMWWSFAAVVLGLIALLVAIPEYCGANGCVWNWPFIMTSA